MTISNVKAIVAKVMTVGLLAGAFALAAPTKAQAETFVAVGVGYPHYGNPGFFEFQRREEFRRHEAFVRHEEFLRAQEFDRFHRDGYWRR